MMEHTKQEIIKGLECCQTQYTRDCTNCPYEKHKKHYISTTTCDSILRKDLLLLINELTKEK